MYIFVTFFNTYAHIKLHPVWWLLRGMTSSIQNVHPHTDKHIDETIKEQFYLHGCDIHTHTHTPSPQSGTLGHLTRWPEGGCWPISSHQVSEYDSDPSKGGTTHSESQTALTNPPPHTPPVPGARVS